MTNLSTYLEQAILTIIQALYAKEVQKSQIQIQKTRKEFDGDVTLVVFPLLKVSGKGPEQTAQEIGEKLLIEVPEADRFNVVKGFLNISMTSGYWQRALIDLCDNPDFGHAAPNGKTFVVEYSSPNTNKPLHLGHLRNNFLGYAVSEILKANGYEVKKVQIINDRGIHICKSMLAWLKAGGHETPESTGTKGDHLVGKYYVSFDKMYKADVERMVEDGISHEIAEKEAPSLLEAQEMLRKWEAGDADTVALWKKMNGWVYQGFEHTYQRMGVDFDKLYYESDTYLLGKDIVQEGLDKGVFCKKEDDSVWIDLSEDGLDEKLLLRKDGTAVYITQDIGTAVNRSLDFPQMHGMIYTVGNEQDYHFKVLFLVLKKLGYVWADQCYHLSYGMVDLPTGKMKSREGTVVDADDLMQEMVENAQRSAAELGKLEDASEEEKQQLAEMIGLSALKYFLLKVDPKKRMLFNPEESIDFQGHTGPFIQYTHARVRSLLRKAEIPPSAAWQGDMEKEEIDVIRMLCEYPEAVAQAGTELNPAVIANYAYELVKAYNHFYQTHPVLKHNDSNRVAFRLALSEQVADVTKRSMKLLGISVPERM